MGENRRERREMGWWVEKGTLRIETESEMKCEEMKERESLKKREREKKEEGRRSSVWSGRSRRCLCVHIVFARIPHAAAVHKFLHFSSFNFFGTKFNQNHLCASTYTNFTIQSSKLFGYLVSLCTRLGVLNVPSH